MRYGVLAVVVVLVVGLGAVYWVPRKSEKPYPVAEYEEYERTADGKPICPRCGRTDDVVRYRYGLRATIGPGEVGAGCVVGSDCADFRCNHCGTNFGLSEMAVEARKRGY
jgi:hypothetical protein